MCNDADIRYIRQDELQKLLDLYKHLHQDDPELHVENIKSLWDQIYHDKICITSLPRKMVNWLHPAFW
jgi:hypothetical protein